MHQLLLLQHLEASTSDSTEDQLWLEQLRQFLDTVLAFHMVIMTEVLVQVHHRVPHNQHHLLEPPHQLNPGDLQDLMAKELHMTHHKSQMLVIDFEPGPIARQEGMLAR